MKAIPLERLQKSQMHHHFSTNQSLPVNANGDHYRGVHCASNVAKGCSQLSGYSILIIVLLDFVCSASAIFVPHHWNDCSILSVYQSRVHWWWPVWHNSCTHMWKGHQPSKRGVHITRLLQYTCWGASSHYYFYSHFQHGLMLSSLLGFLFFV